MTLVFTKVIFFACIEINIPGRKYRHAGEVIASAGVVSTSVSGLSEGNSFRLTVTDEKLATGYDDVQVTGQ
jgi:hypothetical protein